MPGTIKYFSCVGNDSYKGCGKPYSEQPDGKNTVKKSDQRAFCVECRKDYRKSQKLDEDADSIKCDTCCMIKSAVENFEFKKLYYSTTCLACEAHIEFVTQNIAKVKTSEWYDWLKKLRDGGVVFTNYTLEALKQFLRPEDDDPLVEQYKKAKKYVAKLTNLIFDTGIEVQKKKWIDQITLMKVSDLQRSIRQYETELKAYAKFIQQTELYSHNGDITSGNLLLQKEEIVSSSTPEGQVNGSTVEDMNPLTDDEKFSEEYLREFEALDQ